MKLFNTMLNVGKVKYLVNFHDGIKTHKDGSMFFDIRTFKNKKEFEECQDELKKDGYVYVDSSFKITKDNIHLYYEFMSDEEKLKYLNIFDVLYNDRFVSVYNALNISPKELRKNSYILENHISIFYTDFFRVKDTLKPIDEYITEIKDSVAYKEYIATTL